MPFIVALDSHALEESLPEGSKNVLVQGVIDCLWLEEKEKITTPPCATLCYIEGQNTTDSTLHKNVLVQGVIDCLWREEDGWVLVDYKSDHVGKRQTHLILERYSGQIQSFSFKNKTKSKQASEEAK